MSYNIGDYLISTCFDFGGHDIGVKVTHDGYSHWFDASPVRDLNIAHPGYTLLAWAVDADKAKHLEGIQNEYTLKAPVPEEGLRKIREELSPRYWAGEPADDSILDAILEPIFWEHVAPYLSPPVTR
ncbi:MAG: hypothetical protein ABSD29_05670 [Verrucomicrobiota bacterium]